MVGHMFYRRYTLPIVFTIFCALKRSHLNATSFGAQVIADYLDLKVPAAKGISHGIKSNSRFQLVHHHI